MRNLFPILLIGFLSSCAPTSKDITTQNNLDAQKSSNHSTYRSSKGYVDYFVSDVYGPFNVGDPDFDAKFSYRANIDNQRIIESFQLFPFNSQEPYVTTNHAQFLYRNNALIETTFTVPINRYLTNKGLTLKFEILSYPSRQVLKSYSAMLFPCTQPGWSVESMKTGYCFTRSIGFYGSGQALTNITEAFNFHYLDDYIDNEYYYRLDLKNNYIKYDSKFNLTYGSINLKIEDKSNLFPYFSHDSNNNIVIPLKATQEENEKVTFSIKNTLFVNRKTLQMSDSMRFGFIATRDFYFPINERNKLNNQMMNFEVTNFGKSKITASFPLQYIAGEPLVGTSGNARYYVVGGVK